MPAKQFQRGCLDDYSGLGIRDHATCEPVHEVRTSAFWVDRYPVSLRRYDECLAAGACTQLVPFDVELQSGEGPRTFRIDDRMVEWTRTAEQAERVVVFTASYEQAEAFCAWDGARLLTGAEWERMAQGLSDTPQRLPWVTGREVSCGICETSGWFGGAGPLRTWQPFNITPPRVPTGLGGMWQFFEWTSDLSATPFRVTDPPELDPAYPGDGQHELRGGFAQFFSIGFNRHQAFDQAARNATVPLAQEPDSTAWGRVDHGAIRCARTAFEGEVR